MLWKTCGRSACAYRECVIISLNDHHGTVAHAWDSVSPCYSVEAVAVEECAKGIWMPAPEDNGDRDGNGQVFLVGLLVKE